MRAKYLIRFDDICPTMNWGVWDRIEEVLLSTSCVPVIAVVPDNRDSSLSIGGGRADFWERVRKWQRLGWTIGLHGYQHRYVTADTGLVGLNARSEFSGLPIAEQRQKINSALQVFAANGVEPSVWIAPAHSFDDATLSALYDAGIRAISDGFFMSPVRWKDMTWVPQQLWRYRPMPMGIWTICYHPNSFLSANIQSLRSLLISLRDQLMTFDEAANIARPIRMYDRVFAKCWLAMLKAKRATKIPEGWR